MFDCVIRTLCEVRHVLDLRKNLISLGTIIILSTNFQWSNEGEQKCLDSDEGEEAGREYL